MLSRDQEIFDKIISRYKNANLSTRRIEKAYEVAKDLHANQTRNDGTPYIIHPVEVAYILSEFDFDEDSFNFIVTVESFSTIGVK